MSPQNAPFLVLSFTIRTWLRLYDRLFVQGAYIFQVKRPFISLNMVLVSLINYVMISPLLISLRVQKVIRFTGAGSTSLVMEADQELRKFSSVENFNSQK